MKPSHLLLSLLMLAPLAAAAQELVILHTNDTHSTILPDRDGLGGVARRKVLIDSVRHARGPENVMLVDAGDAVQGSLFFTLFGGEVEGRLMNRLGYDLQTLGNHEFDNGTDVLARNWAALKATRLSTNYTFDQPELARMFVPWTLKEIGGKKVGFLALDLDPEGLIAPDNRRGVTYQPAVEAANRTARLLKEQQGADMVVALSHLGYQTDTDADDLRVARASRDIDVIIGGHTHTLLPPGTRVAAADGDSVLIAQTGSRGKLLGEVVLDLATGRATNRLIPVDSRLDRNQDPDVLAIIADYRQQVDSLSALPVAFLPRPFPQKAPQTLNMLSDFVKRQGATLSGQPVDLAIMNKGGIRASLPQGVVTQGAVIDMVPFNNRIVVLDLDGADLLENLSIMATQQGNGVSSGTDVAYDPATGALVTATIDGRDIRPDRRYRVATIDYLAQGNDYMAPLKRGREVANSREPLHQTLRRAMASGTIADLLLRPDDSQRMHPANP